MPEPEPLEAVLIEKLTCQIKLTRIKRCETLCAALTCTTDLTADGHQLQTNTGCGFGNLQIKIDENYSMCISRYSFNLSRMLAVYRTILKTSTW